jgi:hypothetical protein
MSISAPLTFEAEVDDRGRVEVVTSLPPKARVTVLVTPHGDEFTGLIQAAESSLGFWDNPLDDEDWNDAGSR